MRKRVAIGLFQPVARMKGSGYLWILTARGEIADCFAYWKVKVTSLVTEQVGLVWAAWKWTVSPAAAFGTMKLRSTVPSAPAVRESMSFGFLMSRKTPAHPGSAVCPTLRPYTKWTLAPGSAPETWMVLTVPATPGTGLSMRNLSPKMHELMSARMTQSPEVPRDCAFFHPPGMAKTQFRTVLSQLLWPSISSTMVG